MSKNMEKGATGVIVAIIALVLIAIGGFYFLSQKGSSNGNTASSTDTGIATTTKETATTIIRREKNILESVVATPNLTTLVVLLERAGLTGLLSSTTSTFTLFAPTDGAFAKIPRKDLDSLLNDKTKIVKLINYHLVDGNYSLIDAGTTTNTSAVVNTAKPVGGGVLTIKTNATTTTINNAKIETANIKASNGIIYLIDTVLMPK
jgi:uncharacterized surface protein with fasciclin (FAS1) repeats